MEALLESIRAALETKPGQSIAPVMPSMTQLATMVTALRGLPAEQLMDLAIARLRTMVPQAEAAPARSINIPLLQVPHGRP